MLKNYFNNSGKCFARLSGRVLQKSESEKDRLRVTGGRAYAIDALTLRESLNQGAKLLEIHEKTINGGSRVFQIPLLDILRFGREIIIKGKKRWTIPLEACVLKLGPDEQWRIEARKALIKGEDSNTRSQLPLFGA